MTLVFTPQELLQFRRDAEKASQQRRRDDGIQLIKAIGVARPGLIAQLDDMLQSDLDGREYVLQRGLDPIGAGPLYKDFTLEASQLKLFPELTAGTQPSNAVAGKVAIYSEIRAYISPVTPRACIQELLDKAGVRLKYNDSRDPLELPLREIISTATRTPNAGAAYNAASAVEGTQTEVIELGKVLKLDPEDFLVVAPGDSTPNIELFWLTDYAASKPTTPAGSATTAPLQFKISGRLWKKIKRS